VFDFLKNFFGYHDKNLKTKGSRAKGKA